MSQREISFKDEYVPGPGDRSEREHVDLIAKANTGMRALRTISEKYGDMTTQVRGDTKERLEVGDNYKNIDIQFEVKK
jgi:hypothetical protein